MVGFASLYPPYEADKVSGSLTEYFLPIPSNSSQSFAGIGMPFLRRFASVRCERSPGIVTSSKPACRGSALRIAVNASASWVNPERAEGFDVDGEHRGIAG